MLLTAQNIREGNFEPDQRFLAVQPVVSDEGATFEPCEYQGAIGFRVTAQGKPPTFVILNPSGATDDGNLDSSDVFLYHLPVTEDEDVASVMLTLDNPVCYVNIW